MRVIKEWDQDGRHVQVTVSEVGQHYLTMFNPLMVYKLSPDELAEFGITDGMVWTTPAEATARDVGFDVVCPQPDAPPAGYYGCGVGGCGSYGVDTCKIVSARE